MLLLKEVLADPILIDDVPVVRLHLHGVVAPDALGNGHHKTPTVHIAQSHAFSFAPFSKHFSLRPGSLELGTVHGAIQSPPTFGDG